MELTTGTVLLAVVAFIIGGLFVFVVARYREHYLNKGRRERYRKGIELAHQEAELRVRELRLQNEEAMRAKEAEFHKRSLEVDAALAEAARTKALAEARQSNMEQREKELQDMKAALGAERARYRNEVFRLVDIPSGKLREIAHELVKQECANDIARLRREIIGRGETEIRAEARRVLVDTMQRLTTEVSHEANAVLVTLPTDSTKARLIGREGRNIRAFEEVTGVTLLIDETPNSVLVSSFDPVRREVARLALERLIKDGRVHPESIEQFVKTAREEVLRNAIDLGRNAIEDLDLVMPSAEIVALLGRLHFRLSVNQNTLTHSIEVARIGALIACELGIDPLPAKRAGLLHDIGKAIDADDGDSHALAAGKLLRREGERPDIVNAVEAHHGEVEPKSIYAPIVVLADKISASRPGARISDMNKYFERAQALEKIAKSFPGVTEAFSVRAGADLRVSINAGKLTDDDARETARRIRLAIEEKNYPGTIHITVIRSMVIKEEAR
jgi:ribonuclease Y